MIRLKYRPGFKRLIPMCLITLAFVGLARSQSAERAALQAEVHACLQNLPFEMPEIQLPEFPDKIFNIRDFGAVADGQTLNTEAINKAIQTCSQSGGGTVVIPSGLWLSGPIQLQSNVNLNLQRGALVVFSPDHKDYPIIDPPRKSPIAAPPVSGFNLENIAITGEGMLDGSGETWRPVKRFKTTASQWRNLLNSGGVVEPGGEIWWPSREGMEGELFLRNLGSSRDRKELSLDDYLPARDFLRPDLILLVNCRNVLIDGPTLKNSPKFTLHPEWCSDIVIRNVQVNNEWWAQNGDGIDIGSCKNVLIQRCTVTAGDDAYCMKSSGAEDVTSPALQNVVMRDCIAYHGHGGFVIGSNTDGGIRNIYVDNCDFIGTDIGLRFKSARDRGGLVDNIFISNIYMKDIVNEALLFNTYYENMGRDGDDCPVSATTPIFQNFYIDSVYSIGSKQAASMIGLPEMPIRDIRIRNSYFAAETGFEADYAQGITLENVGIAPRSGPVFLLKQSSDFILKNISFPRNVANFISLVGEKTKSIRIEETDLSFSPAPLKFAGDVDKSVVTIR